MLASKHRPVYLAIGTDAYGGPTLEFTTDAARAVDPTPIGTVAEAEPHDSPRAHMDRLLFGFSAHDAATGERIDPMSLRVPVWQTAKAKGRVGR